jgi:hypothetical protein
MSSYYRTASFLPVRRGNLCRCVGDKSAYRRVYDVANASSDESVYRLGSLSTFSVGSQVFSCDRPTDLFGGSIPADASWQSLPVRRGQTGL